MKNNNTSYYSLSAYSTAADTLNTLHRFFFHLILTKILLSSYEFYVIISISHIRKLAQSHDWALIAPRSGPL